ncbi:MAG: hypothetical protein GYA61_02640 [Spirochaetales bacterium]|jgi:hypothetical protein|nr:hypothetical protein [Exilispira sp.]NMC67101.1 hypothetical protein [Spirochaetales bacterium]
MEIKDKIFDLLAEFNASSELDQYSEDNINDIILKYPKLSVLFKKYLSGKLNEVEEMELYFVISHSKVILSALNQYYNENLAEEVKKKVERKKDKSLQKSKREEYLVFINRYKDKLISNMQLLSNNKIAQGGIDNKKVLFVKLDSVDYKFIFSIEYRDENYKTIDNIRLIALPYDDRKNLEEDLKANIECKIQVDAGIIPIKLKLNNPILIKDVVKLYSFSYKEAIYTFIQYGNITNENIGYIIEYISKKKEKSEFERYLKESFINLFNNHSLILDLILNRKYIKVIFNDDDIIIPFSYEFKKNHQDVIDFILNEFGFA